jgi:protocatechuate 3,4-dioxygenase beta subunit
MSSIQGRVVDSHGRPVPHAAVYIESAPVSLPDIAVVTDERGSFVLNAPSPGPYRIGATAEGHGQASLDVQVEYAEDARIEVRLGSG